MRTQIHAVVAIFLASLAVFAADSPYERFRDMKVPIRTPLIREFLPDCEVVALPFLYCGEKGLIITDKLTGRSTRCSEHWTAPSDEANYSCVSDVSGLLAGRRIRVADDDTAIRMAQLVEDITHAPSDIKMAMIHSGNFNLFEGRAYTSSEDTRSEVRYDAEKKDGLWVVVVTYTGPQNVSIMAPPVYEIETDDDARFVDIRWGSRGGRPARKE